MNAKINKEDLHGEWVHSSEEDTPDETVFRPADYDFPLTRRPRETIELKADGKLVKGVATASDSVEEAQGNWELADNNKIAFNTESEPHQTLEIALINKDKLVIKK